MADRRSELAKIMAQFTRRAEFANLSMDLQGELLTRISGLMAEVKEHTGLDLMVGLGDDFADVVCPNHVDMEEVMRQKVKFNDDHEGHFFEVEYSCPMCGQIFEGNVCRVDDTKLDWMGREVLL